MAIITTERLILRKFRLQDASFILELLNTPTWLQFIGDRSVKTIEDACNYILNGPISSYIKNGFGLYAIELKDEQIPIGMCGLIKRDTLENIDIGFALLPSYEGKGYAFEAASATLHYAKNNLDIQHIIAITSKENSHSIHLLTKLGLHFEKMLKLPHDEKELMLFTQVQDSTDTKLIIDKITTAFFNLFSSKDDILPELNGIYELFIPQGLLIKNSGSAPEVYSLKQFIEPREKLFKEKILVNFKEEELSEKTEIVGNIAHRLSIYQKTGKLNGQPFETKGIKSFQFIKTEKSWKISSLAWDDEREDFKIRPF